MLFKFADVSTKRTIAVNDGPSAYLKYNRIAQPVLFVINENGKFYLSHKENGKFIESMIFIMNLRKPQQISTPKR